VGAATLSQVGDAIVYFALGWAASAYGSFAAGLVLAAITVPRTALMLLGGAVADRLGPRVVLLAADGALLAGSLAAAVASAVLGSPLWLLVAVALVIGVATSFYFPASGALPARLVEPAALPRAMALRNAGQQAAMLAGGPLGGPIGTNVLLGGRGPVRSLGGAARGGRGAGRHGRPGGRASGSRPGGWRRRTGIEPAWPRCSATSVLKTAGATRRPYASLTRISGPLPGPRGRRRRW
jgi:MFS family permease